MQAALIYDYIQFILYIHVTYHIQLLSAAVGTLGVPYSVISSPPVTVIVFDSPGRACRPHINVRGLCKHVNRINQTTVTNRLYRKYFILTEKKVKYGLVTENNDWC